MKSQTRLLLAFAAAAISLFVFSAPVMAAPPANDNFANAQALSLGATTTGSTTDATSEINEPGTPNATIWFKVAAPSGGWVVFDVCTTGFTTTFANGFTGTELANLVDNDDYYASSYGCDEPVRVQLSSAGTAYLQIDQATEVTVTASFHAAPANDNFANATEITGVRASLPYDNSWATTEDDEVPDDYYDGHSLWYSWTAPADGRLFVSVCAPEPESGTIENKISLYSWDGSLSAVADNVFSCNGDFDGGSLSNIEVTSGTAYRMKISSYYRDEYYGAGDFELAFFSSAPNENVAAAIDLGNGTSAEAVGNTIYAATTAESGEPLLGGGQRTRSVWYKWTAPIDGDYTIDQCQWQAGTADLILGAFTSGASNPAPADLLFLPQIDGTGDDNCGTGVFSNYNSAGWITINATAGTTYWFMVANYSTTGAADGSAFSIRLGLSSRTATTAPTISGLPFVGRELALSAGEWDAAEPFELAYQWLRCDSAGEDCDEILAATDQDYAVVEDDLDHTIRVEVTATNFYGESAVRTAPTALIDNDTDADGVGDDGDNCPAHDNEAPKMNGCPIIPINVIAPPVVTGTAQIGSALTLNLGSAQNANAIDSSVATATPAFEWQSCGSAVDTGSCESRGSAALVYTPTASDSGRVVRGKVTWSNGDESKVLWTDATAAVPAQLEPFTLPGVGKSLGTVKAGKGKLTLKKLKVNCSVACAVTTTLSGKAGKKKISARATLKVAAGGSGTVVLKLSKKELGLIKKAKKAKATVSVSVSAPGQPSKSLKTSLTLKP